MQVQSRGVAVGESALKSSFSIVVICTTRRRIPARASANQGPESGGLMQVQSERVAVCESALAPAAPPHGRHHRGAPSTAVALH